VTVRQSLEEINEVFELKAPKSKSGIRRIAVPAMAAEALHAHRRMMTLEGKAAAATVFSNSFGGFVSKQNLHNHTWNPTRDRVGLEGFTSHSLRHASASLLPRSEIHPEVVQERRGHSDFRITLGIDSHPLEGMGGGAADAMPSPLKTAKFANGCKRDFRELRQRKTRRRTSLCISGLERVARPGFEPELSDPESLVLPLHHRAIFAACERRTNQSRHDLRRRRCVPAIRRSIMSPPDLPILTGVFFDRSGISSPNFPDSRETDRDGRRPVR